jgi:pimeloyl-ACP methyl ester carboxylesterase
MAGLIDLVDALHRSIAQGPRLPGAPSEEKCRGITGLVYRSVRSTSRLVGESLDAILASLVPMLGPRLSTPEREAVLAALNGVLGDHLVKTGNPLAISACLRHSGGPLVLERSALESSFPGAGGRLAVFAHGLCMNDLGWNREGHDHAAVLARDLGTQPIHLHYNSGLHTSVNGRAFADLLETLVESWPRPVEELVLVGHSMGGLVSRSACHYGKAAGHLWPQALRALVTLGTPHHGAPLERIGNWVGLALQATPYASHFARLGRIRSAGITDLRHGNLLDEDWEGRDRFARGGDTRHAVPMAEGVPLFSIAGMVAKAAKEEGGAADRLVGDGLVPLESALGHHRNPDWDLGLPPSRQWVAYGTSHLDLLRSPEVTERLRGWLAPPES